MHPLLWNLLQLLLHTARDLHSQGLHNESCPEYTQGQVNLIMDAVGIAGGDANVYDILTETITHQTGEIDALVKLQRILQK